MCISLQIRRGHLLQRIFSPKNWPIQITKKEKEPAATNQKNKNEASTNNPKKDKEIQTASQRKEIPAVITKLYLIGCLSSNSV